MWIPSAPNVNHMEAILGYRSLASCPQLIWANLHSLLSCFWGWEIQTWVFEILLISGLLNSLTACSWAGLSFSPLLTFTHI